MKHLILALFLLAISQFATSQTLKAYSGVYQGGEATYTYYENSEGERIKEGEFTFSKGDFAMSGKYKNNNKDGQWTYNYYNLTAIGDYKDGKMNGLFSFIKKNTYSGKVTVKEYNLKNNRIVGPINGYYNHKKIIGQFDNNGFPDGKWITQYESDNLYIITETYFHGLPVSKTKKNESTGEIEQDEVPSTRIPYISPQEFIEAYDSISNKATINGGTYITALDDIPAHDELLLANRGTYITALDDIPDHDELLPAKCESEFREYLSSFPDIAFQEDTYERIRYSMIIRTDNDESNTGTEENDAETVLLSAVDQMPEFPGGNRALMRYLSEHLDYSDSEKKGILCYLIATVKVMFVITKTGKVGEIFVIDGTDPELDAEAIRLVKSLPKFTPGKLNGQAVNVRCVLPLEFKLPVP